MDDDARQACAEMLVHVDDAERHLRDAMRAVDILSIHAGKHIGRMAKASALDAHTSLREAYARLEGFRSELTA